MSEIRQMIGSDSLFVTFEPTCIDGEDRDAYLDRYETVARNDWSQLTADELVSLLAHVRSFDHPESMASWHKLGSRAGFAQCDMLFTGAHDLFRMVCFSS